MSKDLYAKGKKITKKQACMKFNDATRPLYLKTDVSDVGLGAKLLQVRKSMNCGHDVVPDNASLCPVAFAS